MNRFDSAVMAFFNQWAQRSELVDQTILFLSGNSLVKAGLLLMVFWGGWFHVSPRQKPVQLHIVSTMFGCFFAMVIARIMVLALPLRNRPLHEDSLDFTLPIGLDPTLMDGWSAFPSDHATLFYALSAGTFYIHRTIGIAAMVYTTLFIALPRIYLGFHYPSDIVAGAIIGCGVVYLCNSRVFIDTASMRMWRYSCRWPEVFYPVLFLVTYQVADLFDNSRELVRFGKTFVELFVAGRG